MVTLLLQDWLLGAVTVNQWPCKTATILSPFPLDHTSTPLPKELLQTQICLQYPRLLGSNPIIS